MRISPPRPARLPLARRFALPALLPVLLPVLLAAACGGATGGGGHGASHPTPSPTPVCHRGPAMVQVENSPDARPLSGIQQADIVYEYLTEGGITRLTAIYFHPGGTQRIEPVRSARLITLTLQRAYQGVIFYSGASDHVQGLMWGQHVPEIRDDGQHTQFFQRDPHRYAPHNLFTRGDWLANGQAGTAPCLDYTPPAPGIPAAASAPATARIAFNQSPQHRSIFAFDAQAGAYTYAVADTGAMKDGVTGQPLLIKNLVLIQVAHHNAGYTEDVAGAPGIAFDLTGSGPADVFTGGHHYTATWDVSDPARPLRILGANGTAFPMPAGLTWISVIDPGAPVAVS